MKSDKFDRKFGNFLEIAARLAKAKDADAIVVMIGEATDWAKLKKAVGKNQVIVLAEKDEDVEGISEHELGHVVLDMESSPVFEKLSQGLLKAVAE